MADITRTRVYKDACLPSKKFLREAGTFENAWNTCRSLDWMFWGLERISYSDKKILRLFACWCVRETKISDGRKVWDLLVDERSRRAVEVAEQYAKGNATYGELKVARKDAISALGPVEWSALEKVEQMAKWAASEAAMKSTERSAYSAAVNSASWSIIYLSRQNSKQSDEIKNIEQAQINQLRKMIPNPFKGNKVIVK